MLQFKSISSNYLIDWLVIVLPVVDYYWCCCYLIQCSLIIDLSIFEYLNLKVISIGLATPFSFLTTFIFYYCLQVFLNFSTFKFLLSIIKSWYYSKHFFIVQVVLQVQMEIYLDFFIIIFDAQYSFIILRLHF